MCNRRKQTLHGNEEFFRRNFDNAQIGIGIFDIRKAAHFSNRALHELLGYSVQKLTSLERSNEIVHPAERASTDTDDLARLRELLEASDADVPRPTLRDTIPSS